MFKMRFTGHCCCFFFKTKTLRLWLFYNSKHYNFILEMFQHCSREKTSQPPHNMMTFLLLQYRELFLLTLTLTLGFPSKYCEFIFYIRLGYFVFSWNITNFTRKRLKKREIFQIVSRNALTFFFYSYINYNFIYESVILCIFLKIFWLCSRKFFIHCKIFWIISCSLFLRIIESQQHSEFWFLKGF